MMVWGQAHAGYAGPAPQRKLLAPGIKSYMWLAALQSLHSVVPGAGCSICELSLESGCNQQAVVLHVV
jgi:hypothetical protein